MSNLEISALVDMIDKLRAQRIEPIGLVCLGRECPIIVTMPAETPEQLETLNKGIKYFKDSLGIESAEPQRIKETAKNIFKQSSN